MSVRILVGENPPINIDSYLSLPAPGPEQPTAADDGFPSVRRGRALGRIVTHSLNPLVMVATRFETAGNCNVVTDSYHTSGQPLSFDEPEFYVQINRPDLPHRMKQPAVVQFDADNDWITRNINGRRNVVDPIINAQS